MEDTIKIVRLLVLVKIYILGTLELVKRTIY